jgi:predicted ABC-type ATPase
MTNIDFTEIEQSMIGAAVASPSPILVHSLGIPGCGKSSLFKVLERMWHRETATPPTILGFDQVMQSHSDYQAHPDKIAAFDVFEIPAREAGYRILDKLMQKKAHILFDNGGSAESHRELLRRARDEYGYQLIFVSVITPVSIASARVDIRAEQSGQHTPMHYLQERFDKLQKLIPDYRSMAHSFYEIENAHDDMSAYVSQCEVVSTEILAKIKEPSLFKDGSL